MAREFLKNIKSENRLDKIRLIMKNDDVIGGQPSDNENEFTSNTPLLDLACTMKYAVDEIEKNKTGADTDISAIKKSLNTKAEKSEVETALQLKTNTSTNVNAGNGLVGGGDLTTNRTLSLGTPSTISQNTKNSVTQSSHTHEIAKATTSQAGITQLTNTIDTSQDKASTPIGVKTYVDAQIKAISEVDTSHLVEKKQIANELGDSTELVASQDLVTSLLRLNTVNLTEQRSKNTVYTNTTNAFIFLTVSGLDERLGAADLRIDGIAVAKLTKTPYTATATATVIVPPGSTYELGDFNFNLWVEVRQ